MLVGPRRIMGRGVFAALDAGTLSRGLVSSLCTLTFD